MYKTIVLLIATTSIFLAGCTPVSEIKEVNTPQEQTAQIGELKYKLVLPESFSPSFLTLHEDSTFTLDFNLCHFMAQGSGKYIVDKDKYLLDVESCTNCDHNEYNNSVGIDYDLPSVNLELKKISETELKIQNEVVRTENGEKQSFCAPSNDPENKYDGEEYSLFRLIQK